MKKLETDVCVIAAGASGMAAMIAAAQKGAKVISFEKGSTPGGAANMGMGPFAVESRLQKLKQIPLDRAGAFKMFMDYTHWRTDARLTKAYIDKSGDTIDWLEKLGVQFVEPAAYFPGGQFTWHLIKPAVGQPGPMASATMITTLTARAKELGIEIMLQTPAKKILKQGDKIVGVMGEDNAGEQVQVMCKAAIICTGGFGDNPEMIKKYTPYEWGKDLYNIRIPGLKGDGIRMAWEVGAMPTEMNIEMTPGMNGDFQDPRLMMCSGQPHLMVNLLGERFMNEEVIVNTTFTGNAIAAQKNRNGFLIFDDNIREIMETIGLDHVGVVMPITKIDNVKEFMKALIGSGYKDAWMVDSLEELCAQSGIDLAGLKQTIEEYNGNCVKGYDYLFDKAHHLLRPITKPPFYAFKMYAGGYGTLGGIKINYKTEVLNKEWKRIPGLYAAGTDANNIYGDSYPFILPGNTMGFALNSGRIAGENAADYAKSLQ